MYLQMSAFHTVCLPPLANVPAHCTLWTNAFAAMTGDRTAKWPFAKLLWTHFSETETFARTQIQERKWAKTFRIGLKQDETEILIKRHDRDIKTYSIRVIQCHTWCLLRLSSINWHIKLSLICAGCGEQQSIMTECIFNWSWCCRWTKCELKQWNNAVAIFIVWHYTTQSVSYVHNNLSAMTERKYWDWTKMRIGSLRQSQWQHHKHCKRLLLLGPIVPIVAYCYAQSTMEGLLSVVSLSVC